MAPGSHEPRPETGALVNALKDSLNALVVCLSHSWGGLEQVAASDTLDLAAQGLRVKVLCLEGSPLHENLSKHQDAGAKLNVVPLDYRPREYFDLKLRKDLQRMVSEGINLIHSHQTSLLGSISPWLWNSPHVGLFASRQVMFRHDLRNFFHQTIFGRLDALLVMSQTLRENAVATHPIKERRIRVVNLGLDFDLFDPERVDAKKQRQLWGADEDTIVVGLVGRIDPAKGQATLIRAAAGLLKSKKPNEKLKFVIVGEETLGSSSEHLGELKAMVDQFRIQENVVFAGYQENIPEVMRAFDVFVMPSKQESFGLVAIEAMAMECPIVISRGGSAKEIVGNEEFGLMMRPEDAFDLQGRLRHLLDRPLDRVEMGRRARAHVMAFYDRKVRLNLTLALYERSLRLRGAL